MAGSSDIGTAPKLDPAPRKIVAHPKKSKTAAGTVNGVYIPEIYFLHFWVLW